MEYSELSTLNIGRRAVQLTMVDRHVDCFEAHEVRQLVDDEGVVTTRVLVNALNATFLPVRPVQILPCEEGKLQLNRQAKWAMS